MTTSYAMNMADLDNSGIRNLINLLPGIVILLDDQKNLIYFSADAALHGLVRDKSITLKVLSDYVKNLKPGFIKANTEISHYNRNNKITQQLEVDAIQIEQGFILLLVSDLTHAIRIEQTRRDFIANISHELKTPVSALELLSEAIRGADGDPVLIKKFSDKIPGETKRLANLIKDIIDLSRIQSDNPLDEPEIVSVSNLIAQALDSVESIAIKHDVTIEVKNGIKASVKGDEKQLATALKNLLINAVYHTGEDKKVQVIASESEFFVDIDVQDSGEGITPEDQLRIFERFYRVDSARRRTDGGSGIGLSIVKHICNNHGGRALVDSKMGKGTTFTMQLPLNQTLNEI